MQWITVVTPPFETVEELDSLLPQIGHPDGLEARYVGTTDGQLRIVALWESKEHADTFFAETLPSVLAKALGPEPAGSGVSEMVGIEVARSYVRQPVG
jgi:hypothetical protein